MNAIDLLKADHDRVEKLFGKFRKNENGNNSALFRKIRGELETHTHIEETIFYSAGMKRGKKDLKKIIREGLEEHGQVKTLLAELSKMTARNKQFNPKLTVVVENVEHHVEEEEDEMFPLFEDQFSDAQLEKLGEEMEAEKLKFQKKHRIKPLPDEKGTIATVIDKASEMVNGLLSSPSNGKTKRNDRRRAGSSASRTRTTTKPQRQTAKKSRAARTGK